MQSRQQQRRFEVGSISQTIKSELYQRIIPRMQQLSGGSSRKGPSVEKTDVVDAGTLTAEPVPFESSDIAGDGGDPGGGWRKCESPENGEATRSRMAKLPTREVTEPTRPVGVSS